MGEGITTPLNLDRFDTGTFARHDNNPPTPTCRTRAGEATDFQASYRTFILDSERYGLPTRFLREVEPNFSVGRSWFGGDSVYQHFQVMSLSLDTIQDVECLSPLLNRGASGIGTIYHESTHAWFQLKSKEPAVADIIRKGTAYYERAPLQGGAKADDPARVFNEAAASYVGGRVGNWWLSFQGLSFLAAAHARRGDVQRFIAQQQRAYNRAMAERTFGYQDTGGLLGIGSQQTATTRQISDQLKRFLDETILDGTIPETFGEVTGFQRLISEIYRRQARDR
jgi:hypothetical protein